VQEEFEMRIMGKLSSFFVGKRFMAKINKKEGELVL